MISHPTDSKKEIVSHIIGDILKCRENKQNTSDQIVKIMTGHLPLVNNGLPGTSSKHSDFKIDTEAFGVFSNETWKLGCMLSSELTKLEISSQLIIILDDKPNTFGSFRKKSSNKERQTGRKNILKNHANTLPDSYMNTMNQYQIDISNISREHNGSISSYYHSEMKLASFIDKIKKKGKPPTKGGKNSNIKRLKERLIAEPEFIENIPDTLCTKAYTSFVLQHINPQNDYLVGFVPRMCTQNICSNVLADLDYIIDSKTGHGIDATHYFFCTNRNKGFENDFLSYEGNSRHTNERIKTT